jgi:hypothetical protein
VRRPRLAGVVGIVAFGPVIGGGLPPALAGVSNCTRWQVDTRCVFDNRVWGTENSGASWTISGVGNAHLRFEVRRNDIAPWDAEHHNSANRTEISESDYEEPVNKDIWVSFGLMVQPGPTVTSQWLVLGQLKARNDSGGTSGSPPWAQELDAGDQFRIVIRTSTQQPQQNSPAPNVLFVDPKFKRGRIYQFVYRIRYSQTRGILEAWRDSRKIVDYSGPLGYVGRQGPYFKFGIYRQPAPETVAATFYDLKIGGAELMP